MTYDFTTLMDRQGKDALALDVDKIVPSGALGVAVEKIRDGFSPIPMWVADMNFATVPTIPEAIIRRAEHPAYGYFLTSDAYYDAIIRWQERRNGVTGLTRECIGYENGVLGGVASAAAALCSRGDKILVHSPTYIGFTHALGDNGYELVLSPLVQDADGIWRMDYDDMEAKLRDGHIHTALLCSPHNPCGRVWERWELEKAMALFKKYDVYVISDEIWSDLTRPGQQHIPTQSVSDDARHRTVAFYAPSKTFNLAGLIGSYHLIYNPWLADRVRREGANSCYNNMNVLSMHALIAAYSDDGARWVDELRQVLAANIDDACDFIDAHFDGVRVTKPEGTYMLFLDCSRWCAAHGTTIAELLARGIEVGVLWQDGRKFHGDCHIRMNLALPHSLVVEAFERLDRYVFNA
ncbi:MAG: aminotransferase class I/II-fold pyridoxal phosphate-dependent enzyme [Peptococcaceae bacterium]|nr:aminotransferase class I/II-fold pyridoxal phosphate-dependent enzyme [Peptococcaceae bacterium]